MNLRPLVRMTLADGAVRQIQNHIATGALHVGERLPSERMLAEQFGVSRAVIREAMQRLQAMGLVEIHPGRGVFVSDGLQHDAPLFPWLPSEKADLLLLAEVLDALESRAAYLAAKNASDETLESIQRNLALLTEQSAAASPDFDAIQKLDAEFHSLVAQASSNPFLADLNNRVNTLLNATTATGRFQVLKQVRGRVAEHARIVEEIMAGNAAGAAEAAAKHVRTVKAVLARIL